MTAWSADMEGDAKKKKISLRKSNLKAHPDLLALTTPDLHRADAQK